MAIVLGLDAILMRGSRHSGKILSKNKEEIFYGYCTGP